MGNSNSGIVYLKKMELKLINLELKFATKKTLYCKQVSIEERLAPYEVMDDFKLATTLDPRSKLDRCQNDKSWDICDLLTSQVV